MTDQQDTGSLPPCQEDEWRGPDCYVYVIGFDLKKSPSKVGIASNPVQRMSGLQTAHHQRLILGGSWRLPAREMARSLELAFHETQKCSRLSGEWFDLTPEQCMILLHFGFAAMLNVVGGLGQEQIEEVLEVTRYEHPESDWWKRKRGANG